MAVAITVDVFEASLTPRQCSKVNRRPAMVRADVGAVWVADEPLTAESACPRSPRSPDAVLDFKREPVRKLQREVAALRNDPLCRALIVVGGPRSWVHLL